MESEEPTSSSKAPTSKVSPAPVQYKQEFDKIDLGQGAADANQAAFVKARREFFASLRQHAIHRGQEDTWASHDDFERSAAKWFRAMGVHSGAKVGHTLVCISERLKKDILAKPGDKILFCKWLATWQDKRPEILQWKSDFSMDW